MLLSFVCPLLHAQTNVNTQNLSFDDGSLNGWTLYLGDFYYDVPSTTYKYNWTLKTPAQTGNRIKIIGNTSTTNDPIIGCSSFYTNPNNKLVARLGEPLKVEGNTGTVNAASEKMEYTFVVTPNTTLLSYKLAAVLRVPQADTSHLGEQRPTYSMEIIVTDNNGVSYTLPCSSYSSKADNGNASLTANSLPCLGSIAGTNAKDYVYQKWLSGNIDLSNQIGKNVTISIINHDCLSTSGGNLHAGAHESYGYFWAETKKIELTSFSCENSDATITAPQGFTSYNWTRSDGLPITVPNPAEPWKVIINQSQNLEGVEYSCAMNDATSACGAITVKTIITPIKLHPDFTNVAVDAGKIQFTNTSTAEGDTIKFYQWDFGDGIGYSNQKNPIYTYSEFKPFNVRLTVTSSKGCIKTINYNVLPTKELIATITPPAYLVYDGHTKDFSATTNIAGLQLNIDYYIRYTNRVGTPFYNSLAAPATVGEYTATFELSYLSLIKYFMTSVPTVDFEITKAPLTITVNSVTKTYGESISLLREGFTQDMKPLFAGDKIYELDLTCNGLKDTASVGTYDIVPTKAIGLGVDNYAITFVNGTLTVLSKPLVIKAIDATRIYGTPINITGKEFSIAAGSFVDKDTVLSVVMHCAGLTQLAAYGNYPITIDGAIGRRLGNYTLTYTPAELVVEKKKITVTANILSKVYGTDYSFTGKEYTSDKSQFVGTDSIASVQLVSAASPQKVAVGDYGLTMTDVLGAGITNYDMKWVNATFKVVPMPIVITATSKTKEYGDLQGFSGNEFTTDKTLVAGDTLSFVMLKSSGSVETAPIGAYTIFASQAYGIGTLNYDFSYVSGQLNVVKKKVTAAIFPPSYLVYNAQNKDFTVTVNVGGLLQNVDYFIRYTSKDGLYNSTTAPLAAGDYTATFELSAISLNNYELTNSVTADFSILKAPLTITPDNSQKTYGETLSLYKNAFKTDIKPLYGSDRIDELELSCNGLKDTSSVGTYPIIATKAIGFGVDNYAIHFDEGALTVPPKYLTIAALNANKTYGEQINANGNEFYIAPGSLVGADNVSAVQLQCSGYDYLSTIGNYTIAISSATGYGLSNYVISYSNALLSVEKKKITVNANKLSKTYGTTYTFSGKEFNTDKSLLVGTDSVSDVQLLSSATVQKAPVGEYSLSLTGIVGYRLDNYDIKLLNNTYKVNPMPITIIANNKVKEYSDLMTFSGSEFTTNTALVAGDTVSFVLMKSAGSIESAPINNYDIQISLAYGAGTMNYDFSYAPATLSVIKKDLIAIIYPPAYLGYNAKTKDFTATTNVSGLLQNFDYQIRYINKAGTADYNNTIAPSAAGDYTASFELTASSLLKYNLMSTPTQDFTITKAPLTITADDMVKTYGDKANLVRDAFKTDIKPLFGSDQIFELDLSSAGVIDTASVGTFAIVPTKVMGQGIENYELKFVNGTLTVKPKVLQIKALDVTKTYGENIVSNGNAFFVDAHSLVANDTVSWVDLQSAGYAGNTTVGSYTITAFNSSGRRLSNYLISYSGANLVVSKKKITVAAQPIYKLYGTQFTFSGNEFTTDTLQLVGTDKISSVQMSSQGSPKKSLVGDYTININGIVGTGLSNYDITQLNNTLKIKPMAISITANNMSKAYGGLLTFNGNEFVTDKPLLNGDTISYVSLKSSGCAETAPVGNYDVLASLAYGVGTMNYEFSYQMGKLSVVKKQLSASIIPPNYLEYNATAKDFTAQVDVPGLIQNTDYFIRYTSKDGAYNSYSAPVNVGDYTATFELSSLSLLKYSMSTTPTKNFCITKAPLAITADNAQKNYGEKLQLLSDAFRMDMNPLFGSDAVFMVDFISQGLVDTASVKTYSILPQNAKGSGIENYDIKYIGGALAVNAKPLLIKATDGSKIYGDLALPNSKNFYVEARELVANDMVTSVTLTSAGYASLATIGAYPIKAANAVGVRMKNYQISYADGNLQVLKKKISVSAKSIYKEYGSEYVFRGTECTAAASQFVGSDKITGAKLNSQGAQSKASVGEYSLAISEVAGNGIDNYDITSQNGVLFVTPKPIVVIGTNLEKEFGDVLTFSGNEFTTDIPLLNNDTISFTFLKSAGTAATTPIGVYDIIPAQASGAGSLNYSISYRPAKLTIVQKQLQVTAKNLVKEYGEVEPDKSFTVSDKRGIAYQTSMFTGKLSRNQGEKVGVYKITKGNLTVASSYSYVFTEGELSIVKALPSIDPVFTNTGGQSIIADVIGSKNGDYPQGNLNIKINDASIDNTTSVIDGISKTAIGALPNHMVQVELNYLGDDNYLSTSTTMNVYALVYHCNGGKVLTPVTNFDGNEAVKIENPTHDDNYKFEGWYDNPDFSGIAIRRVPVATYHDVHLYAKWSVTYDDLSIVVLFNQVLAVANPLNHPFLYNSTYKWFKDGMQLESNKQYCGFENFVPSGNYRVEIYYMSNPAIVVELAHSNTIQKAKLYPNPMKRNSQLTVSSEWTKEKDVSVEIYTLLGARLHTISVEKDGDKFKLNGFNHSGVYMVRLVLNGVMKESHKVIVEE